MAFSPETIQFLYENIQQNSRTWYNAHKDQYQQYVLTPMYCFIEELMPGMLAIDEQFNTNPKRMVSRIYRDMRYCHNTIFHRSIWCCFMRPHRSGEHQFPGFFFEVAPEKFSYGCGFYQPGTQIMNSLRTSIIKKTCPFRAALQAYEGQKVFKLIGNFYKREHYPDMPSNIRNWLNRKDLCLFTESENFERLFSKSLSKKILTDFKKIALVYRFFIQAVEQTE